MPVECLTQEAAELRKEAVTLHKMSLDRAAGVRTMSEWQEWLEENTDNFDQKLRDFAKRRALNVPIEARNNFADLSREKRSAFPHSCLDKDVSMLDEKSKSILRSLQARPPGFCCLTSASAGALVCFFHVALGQRSLVVRLEDHHDS
eukprot:6458436-Amphidinium_carterae.1